MAEEIHKIEFRVDSTTIPLGILVYNVEKDRFDFERLPGISKEELNAFLVKLNLRVTLTKD